MHPRRRQRKNASAMRLVGRQLARFREAAGLTQRGLAAEFNLAEQTVASIEQGRRPLKPDLAARFDDRLDTKGALSVAVDNMPEVDLIPAWAEEFVDQEREALALSSYENQVMPGQLQTARLRKSRVPQPDPDHQRGRHRGTDRHPPTAPGNPAQHTSPEPELRHLGGSAPSATAWRRRGLRCPATAPERPDRASRRDIAGDAVRPHHTPRPRRTVRTARNARTSAPRVHRDAARQPTRVRPGRGQHPDARYAMLRTQALNPEDTTGLLDRLLGEV